MNKKILIVEDDKDILFINSTLLKNKGFTVLEAETIKKAKDILLFHHPDLIILDILLPDGNGIDFCLEIESLTIAPILFLTSLSSEKDIVKGLLSGADDYITKPYSLTELHARILSILRRFEKLNEKTIISTPLKLNIFSQQVSINDKNISLTQKEFQLLHILLKNIGIVLSAEYLHSELWGKSKVISPKLKTHVSSLRKKLGPIVGSRIQNIRGKGYVYSLK